MRDVSPFNVFVPEISYMIASGMSHGYSDGTYRPMNAVTRHAMAAFLWRQAGSPAGPFPASGFSDVNATTPNRTAIEWMAATGVSTGYDDGTFRPAERVSRGAMVAFMWRASGSPPATYSTLYRDVSSSHPFATAITWASRNNIVNGYSDGTFRSGSRTTRQAMAAFVHRWSTDG